MHNIGFSDVKITGGFWEQKQELIRNVTMDNVYDRFTETGRFDALKCLWREGDEPKPHVFWDSDVAKWMEAAAYLTELEPDEDFERKVDEAVQDIANNQTEDGYFNSYYLTVEKGVRFQNRNNHELYCAGHLLEAAIAYHKATGKRKFLDVMIKYTDYIYDVFYVQKSAAFFTPGHEEIELALIKLYRYIGDKKYLDLAKYFIDTRGVNEEWEWGPKNFQSHIPVRQQSEAVGHAVRACYLYTAMADLAKETDDRELKEVCDRLFENIISSKMHITGGIGTNNVGECFTYAYDLPNNETYNETCASIALAFFADSIQSIEPDSRYGDVIEKVLYNGFLSGISLSGDRFFYSNPTEIDLKKHQRDKKWYPAPNRVKVFSCSCCPPNIVRFVGSIARYAYSQNADTLYCHQFMESTANLTVNGKPATITQETNYPLNGTVKFTYHGEPCTLKVRIPEWCVEFEGDRDAHGFATYNLSDGETVTVDLPMKVHFVEANPNVQDDAGRYAVMRGPIVYCLEGVDNGENLRDIAIYEESSFEIKLDETLNVPVMTAKACRREQIDTLYRIKTNKFIDFTAALIPYYAFANRGESGMIVWVQVK